MASAVSSAPCSPVSLDPLGAVLEQRQSLQHAALRAVVVRPQRRVLRRREARHARVRQLLVGLLLERIPQLRPHSDVRSFLKKQDM